MSSWSTQEGGLISNAKAVGPNNNNNKRQITNADYSTEDYHNIKVPANSSQEELDLIYNENVPYEARIFNSGSSNSVLSDENLPIFGEISEDENWLRQERLRHRQLAWYKRPSIYVISTVVFLFTFAHGVSMSSKLQLMINVICRDISKNGGICNEIPEVQKQISKLESIMTITGNILATVLSGKICELSDQYGRKPVITIVSGTLLISKILVLCLIHPSVNAYHPILIVLASSIESLGGGTITIMSLSNTYLSDVVQQKDRILKMGIMSGCLFAGLGVGPFIGSLIIKHYDSNVIACFVDVGIVFLLIIFCTFLFPESRSQMASHKSRTIFIKQRVIQRQGGNDKLWNRVFLYFKHLFAPLKMLTIPEQRGSSTYSKKSQFFILIAIMGFFSLGSVFMGRVLILYPIYVFKWNSVDVGYFITLMMVSRALVLFVLSPYVLKRLSNKYPTKNAHLDKLDLIVLKISLILELAGSTMLTFANSSKVYDLSQLVMCFGSMLNPAIDSMMIKYSPVGEVGQMLGAISMVKNLLAATIPSLLLIIYSATIEHSPRIVLFVMLTLLATANIFAFFLREEDEINVMVDENRESQYQATSS